MTAERKVFVPKSKPTCAKCGAPIGFYRNERGRTTPCNPDGSDHFDLCRERRYAAAKEGKHVDNKREEAWYGKRGRFAVRESAYPDRRTTRSARKAASACRGCTLPWEKPCDGCPAAFKEAA